MNLIETLQEELRDIRTFHLYCLNILLLDADKEEGIDIPDFHLSIYDDFNLPIEGQTEAVFVGAPVGFSKSTCLKIWICYQFVHRLDNACLYASSSSKKSTNQFSTIRKILSDEGLQTIFEYSVTQENQSLIEITWGDNTKSTAAAVASGQGISGTNFESLRPTIIAIDDIEELEQAINVDRTSQLEDWIFITLMSRTPSVNTGKIRMIGTVFSEDALASRIMGISPTYKKKRFVDWVVKTYPALDHEERSIWESRNPTSFLLKKRYNDPISFAANYMLHPMDDIIDGAYYEYYIQKAEEENRFGDHIQWDPELPVYTYWDIATQHDLNAVWFMQYRDGYYNFIDYWEGTGLGTQQVSEIIFNKPYNYDGHRGPHDLKKHHLQEENNKTALAMYAKYGIHFEVIPASSKESGRRAVRAIFHKCRFSSQAVLGFKHLKGYRAKIIPNTQGLRQEVHDIHSHGADAFRMFAVYENPGSEEQQGEQKTSLKKLRNARSQ